MHAHNGVLFVHAGVTPDFFRNMYEEIGLTTEQFDGLNKWDLDRINEEISKHIKN